MKTIPQLLPVRLEKKRPGIVLPALFGLLVSAMAAGLIFLGTNLTGVKHAWLMAVFGVVAAVLGVVMLWSCFYQVLMRGIPLPVVELSAEPLTLGKPARIALIQPGPAHLRGLRLEIVCLERHFTWHKRAPDSNGNRALYSTVDEKRGHTETVAHEADVRAPGDGVWQKTCDFTLPPTAQPTKESHDLDVCWQIEVSGRGGLLTKFLHEFMIEVKRG